MAGQAPPLSPALHPHLGLLAQSGRALLRPDHSAAHPSRRLHLRSRTRSCHWRLSGTPQCRPQALRLDQIRRRNPCKSRPCTKGVRTSGSRESSVKSITLATLCDRRRRGRAGTGRNGAFYSPDAIVSGIDTSPAMLERAQRRCPTVAAGGRLYQMDVTNLEFPAASFDSAVATFLFCVLPNDLQVPALRELGRVVK